MLTLLCADDDIVGSCFGLLVSVLVLILVV